MHTPAPAPAVWVTPIVHHRVTTLVYLCTRAQLMQSLLHIHTRLRTSYFFRAIRSLILRRMLRSIAHHPRRVTASARGKSFETSLLHGLFMMNSERLVVVFLGDRQGNCRLVHGGLFILMWFRSRCRGLIKTLIYSEMCAAVVRKCIVNFQCFFCETMGNWLFG